MKEKNAAGPVLLFAGIWAALSLILRLITLSNLDADGLLPLGSPLVPATVAVCLLGGLATVVLCLRLNRLPGREACFEGGAGWSCGEILAAVLLALSAVLQLRHAEELERPRLVLEYLGLAMSLALGALALLPRRSGGLRFWLRFLPALWACGGMILRFQSWSRDPLLFLLTPTFLAYLSSLAALMLLTGFPLKAGHRRSTAAFGLCAGVYTLMLLPDYLMGLCGSLAELLLLAGLGLWSLLHALRLLRPGIQAETAAPEAPAVRPD